MTKTLIKMTLVLAFFSFVSSVHSGDLEINDDDRAAIIFIPGIHHSYTGDAGLFAWSKNGAGEIGKTKVDPMFAWGNVLTKAEDMGFDTYILFEKGKTEGKYVDGGTLGHKVNEEMITNSVHALINQGYSHIVIMGHSQAGPNIFGALKTMSEKDAAKMSRIDSVKLYDPAFYSPLGSLAAEPLVLPIAKVVTGKVGQPLSPSEEDLTGKNDYLASIHRAMPDMGKTLSKNNIPVYLMYASSAIVSREEIKDNAQALAKNGGKVYLFSPQTGSMKFGEYKEGDAGYMYKKNAPDPNHPKQQVPTESRMAHTPKVGSAENNIATNFYLYGLSEPNKEGLKGKDERGDFNKNGKDMGGVYIDPNVIDNVTVEKGVTLITLKEEIIEKRPSKESFRWRIKLPEGAE